LRAFKIGLRARIADLLEANASASAGKRQASEPMWKADRNHCSGSGSCCLLPMCPPAAAWPRMAADLPQHAIGRRWALMHRS